MVCMHVYHVFAHVHTAGNSSAQGGMSKNCHTALGLKIQIIKKDGLIIYLLMAGPHGRVVRFIE